tara:strand:- start:108 stop:290 length:183 start_codon:yes stop_codon:yes gene_type:complete
MRTLRFCAAGQSMTGRIRIKRIDVTVIETDGSTSTHVRTLALFLSVGDMSRYRYIQQAFS